MRVVRPGKLVLYQHPITGRRILAQDVCTEGADILLLRLQYQFNSDGVTEYFEVVLLRQPRREILILCGPDGA